LIEAADRNVLRHLRFEVVNLQAFDIGTDESRPLVGRSEAQPDVG
jgi:hypothetical protein